MAFSVLPTESVGEVIDAAEWNAIVDDVNWLGQGHPKTHAYNGGASFAQATTVALSWASHLYDTGGMHSTSVNPTRFTAPSTGIYYFAANVVSAVDVESFPFILMLYLNNTTEMARSSTLTIANHQNGIYLASMFNLTAGDYLDVRVFGDKVAAGNIGLVTDYRTSAMMHWLSA